MGILVVGSVAIDDVITPFGKNFNAPGGSATYFSLSASRFTKVKIVAVAGGDFPKKYIRLLKDKGVDITGLEIKDGKTFRWKGVYDWNLNTPKTLDTQLNLFKDFKPVIPKEYRNESIVFLANIDPDLQLDVLKQVKSPRLVAADTISFWIQHKRKSLLNLLKRVDIFIINEFEAREITKEPNLIKAARAVISCGPKRVIIKRGESGLLFISNSKFFVLPAYPLETVYDPTGAGDTFAGGFLGYLSSIMKFNEEAFRKALVYGTIMASFNVEDFDIRALARLNRGLIEKRVQAFKQICRF